MIDPICRQIAQVDDARLPSVIRLAEGLLEGSERKAPTVPGAPWSRSAGAELTLREFGELWTSNELSRRYRRRVKEIEHAENIRRLERHVYPIVFRGQKVGDTFLSRFTLDHGDHVLAQPSLPVGSLRHVAQVIHRVFALAVFPARVLESSPFPRGWLPAANSPRARGYLFPAEDVMLMRHQRIPLVKRVYIGVANREGPRRGNLVMLEWADLLLDFENGAGFVTLDRTKSGRDAKWQLDPGTAEALRRWRALCPSKQWVFSALAVPAARRINRADRPMYVSHLGDELRTWLVECGVTRGKLFETSEHRLRLRAHDLRASFVTLALANGRSEPWVMQRTGHTTSAMLNRYRRDAESILELNLGWFTPLHEAIPEFAAMSKNSSPGGESPAISPAPSDADDSIRCADGEKRRVLH
jgi:integrase